MQHYLAAPADYEALNTTLTIPTGSSQQVIQIAIRYDSVMESVENFRVILRNPSNGVVIAQSEANITINNVICKEALYVYNNEGCFDTVITIDHVIIMSIVYGM